MNDFAIRTIQHNGKSVEIKTTSLAATYDAAKKHGDRFLYVLATREDGVSVVASLPRRNDATETLLVAYTRFGAAPIQVSREGFPMNRSNPRHAEIVDDVVARTLSVADRVSEARKARAEGRHVPAV